MGNSFIPRVPLEIQRDALSMACRSRRPLGFLQSRLSSLLPPTSTLRGDMTDIGRNTRLSEGEGGTSKNIYIPWRARPSSTVYRNEIRKDITLLRARTNQPQSTTQKSNPKNHVRNPRRHQPVRQLSQLFRSFLRRKNSTHDRPNPGAARATARQTAERPVLQPRVRARAFLGARRQRARDLGDRSRQEGRRRRHRHEARTWPAWARAGRPARPAVVQLRGARRGP